MMAAGEEDVINNHIEPAGGLVSVLDVFSPMCKISTRGAFYREICSMMPIMTFVAVATLWS
jgi:hypothetical protein